MTPLKLITIDGPSASGKSSVSRLVAKALRWQWLSTGAFYRGLALVAMEEDLHQSHGEELYELAQSSVWRVEMGRENTEVFYKEQKVTTRTWGEDIGGLASQISQREDVRKALLEKQRNCFSPEQGLVAEGRDCGTVVFPQAPTKIYLTANPERRAKRRAQQEGLNQKSTKAQQNLRDHQDSQRKLAPLKKAPGALTIDSTGLSLEEVVKEVLACRSHKV